MPNGNSFNQQLTASGDLRISVFAQDVGRPASNATVRIAPTFNKTQIIEEVVTDTSGRSPTVELAAPPLDYSMEPGEGKPYSEYDVSVTMEGYQPVNIEGVQILPTTTAIQNISLNPLVRLEEQPENLLIEQHTLWGEFPPKIPEDDVKPLPETSGFVVLPEPVVPEFVVVHAGAPTDTSAQNYWIPFRDYIKNVASCEIYSTWPTSTIEANVLAILSFTLNRVYTEWYRGRGFNFTITNSTAFDQAFTYGRNIYQRISEIVDYLFTNFITRPGIRQPLFTQYCDGQRVSCPSWLSQWGSKFLGDDGLSSVNILRNYYGQDIYLAQAESVSGVPVSFPGVNLQVGSTGEAVRTIQTQLNAISDNYPAISKIRVDGIYGQQTRNAVQTFQEIFNLPQTGIVDFATWYAISNIFVAVERLAELV